MPSPSPSPSASPSPSPAPADLLYIPVGNAGNGDGVEVFSYTPTTHTFAMIGSISGTATLLNGHDPVSLALDEVGNVYVAVANGNTNGGIVYEYPAGSGVSGVDNVAPIRTITSTLVPEIWAAHGLVYLDGQHNFAYATQVYSTVSNTTPALTIAQPANIGVSAVNSDAAGNIYVGNLGNVFQATTNTSTSVQVFSALGTQIATIAQGILQPESMAFDASGNLYVNNYFQTITPSTVCCGLQEYSAAALLTNPTPTLRFTQNQGGAGSAIAIDSGGNLFTVANQLEVFSAGFGPTATPTASIGFGGAASTFSLGIISSSVVPLGHHRRPR